MIAVKQVPPQTNKIGKITEITTECGNDDVAPRPPSDPNAPGATDAISFLAFLFLHSFSITPFTF